MSTQTQTETVTRLEVLVIPRLHDAIENGEKSAAKANARFVDYATILRPEADKLSLSKDAASITLKQSMLAANGFPGVKLVKLGDAKNAKLEIEIPKDADFTVAEVQKELDREKFDVSRVMTLAWPKDENSAKELNLALEHNKQFKDYRQRIGVNSLLEIARGNVTFAHTLNPPKPEVPQAPAGADAAAGVPGQAPQAPAGTPQAPAGTPTAPTPSTESSGPITVQDRFTAATQACKIDGLTFPEAEKLLRAVYGKQ